MLPYNEKKSLTAYRVKNTATCSPHGSLLYNDKTFEFELFGRLIMRKLSIVHVLVTVTDKFGPISLINLYYVSWPNYKMELLALFWLMGSL